MAQLNIGILYAEGIGGVRDKNKAREWLEKAATQGNSDAIAALQSL